jgi:NitT/TauT family transport system substrate-binding protein
MIIGSCRRGVHIIIVLGLLVQGCAFLNGMQATPEPTTLRVLLLPFLSSSPFFIAEEEGYFAEQGLQIEFVRMEKGSQAIPALAQGDLDVVGASVSFSILNAMARGANLKFVAEKGTIGSGECPYDALVARQTLIDAGEVEGPADLQGRLVVIDPTNFEGYYVEKLLNGVNLTLDDIQMVTVPDAVLPEAFEKGTIDLAAISEPSVTRVLQAGHAALWMSAQQVIPDFQFAFVLYGPTLLDANPDAGRRFMVAYLKAVRQHNQGKTERNLEILGKYTDLDRDSLLQACWPAFSDDGQVDARSVLDFQAWGLENEYLESPVSEKQFWDSSFVEYANEELGAPSD